MEDKVGSIARVWPTDTIVLDQSIVHVPVEKVGETQVSTTGSNGEVVCKKWARWDGCGVVVVFGGTTACPLPPPPAADVQPALTHMRLPTCSCGAGGGPY